MCMAIPVQPIVMIFGTAQDLIDAIDRAQFCIDRSEGFGLRKGQICGSPIGNGGSPIGTAVALCVELSYTHTHT